MLFSLNLKGREQVNPLLTVQRPKVHNDYMLLRLYAYFVIEKKNGILIFVFGNDVVVGFIINFCVPK